jgi:HEAT repeat protein
MTYQKLRTTLRTLFVIVAACGVTAWTWHHALESTREPTTLDWISKIDTGTLEDRKLAILRLQEAKPAEIAVVIPVLTRALLDSNVSIRLDAALALAQSVISPAIADQQTALMDHAPGVANSLRKVLKEDDDASVRGAAANALTSIRRALVKAKIPVAESSPSDPLNPAALVMAFDAEMGRDPMSRSTMIGAFEQLGPVPLPAPPALLEALDDPDVAIRGQTLKALGQFASGVDRAIPILLKDLETNTSRFAPDYQGTARKMRPSPAVVPVLIESLESGDGLVREAATVLLGRVEPAPRAAGPALMLCVKKALSIEERSDSDPSNPDISGAGGGIGPSSGNRPTAAPPGSVSADLAKALARTASPEDAVPLLIEVLKRRSPGARRGAAAALAEIGPAAHGAIPALAASLREALSTNGRSATGNVATTVYALGCIAPKAPEAQATSADVLAVIAQALKANNASVRAAAAEASGNFGPKAVSALPTLRELLKDQTAAVRDAAEAAIKKIESKSEPTNEPQP